MVEKTWSLWLDGWTSVSWLNFFNSSRMTILGCELESCWYHPPLHPLTPTRSCQLGSILSVIVLEFAPLKIRNNFPWTSDLQTHSDDESSAQLATIATTTLLAKCRLPPCTSCVYIAHNHVWEEFQAELKRRRIIWDASVKSMQLVYRHTYQTCGGKHLIDTLISAHYFHPIQRTLYHLVRSKSWTVLRYGAK